MKKNRLLIAPVFISHEGCPYRCAFCSQTDITGYSLQVDKENVLGIVKKYLEPTYNSNRFDRREVAFYGGSFTGLSADRQKFLLSLIQPLIQNNQVDAIRVSTHPLFIDHKKLKYLKNHGVETIELGVQSTNQEVLNLSGRPCSRKDLLKAVFLIKKHGFKLGLQLMLGLPGDDEKRFMASVNNVISMKPNFVRLYPSLVLKHTPIYAMYKKGLYAPWSLERTLDALKVAVKTFQSKDIAIARVGLQPDSSLQKNLIAGPFHPSLRYLVDCKIGFDLMAEKILSLVNIPNKVLFKVPKNFISIYVGNRRENLRLLKEKFGLDDVELIGEEKCCHLELVA